MFPLEILMFSGVSWGFAWQFHSVFWRSVKKLLKDLIPFIHRNSADHYARYTVRENNVSLPGFFKRKPINNRVGTIFIAE